MAGFLVCCTFVLLPDTWAAAVVKGSPVLAEVATEAYPAWAKVVEISGSWDAVQEIPFAH